MERDCPYCLLPEPEHLAGQWEEHAETAAWLADFAEATWRRAGARAAAARPFGCYRRPTG